MFFLSVVIVALTLLFTVTVFFGPPYVRSHKQPVETALDILGLKKDDHLLDLGSGDGAVLLAAAHRGVRTTGYELNPILWLVSLWRTRKFRSLVSARWGNMWQAPINDHTQNIYVFSDKRFLRRLDKMISSSSAKVTLVSYSYKIPGKKITKVENGMYLYEYGNK